MPRERYNDLLAFIAVARERSFTRAAAQLGVSQSALSHMVRALEARMGVRLLMRTTRSVSPTQAGDRLMRNVAPLFQEIAGELASVGELRDKPAGTVRITAIEDAVDSIIWPRLPALLETYPDIKVEIDCESRFVDIVAERFDMGVRLGDGVAKDMTAVRIGPDIQMAMVGAPAYLSRRRAPARPQDLVDHDCINLRLMSQGGLYAWDLEKGRQQVSVRVEGRLVFNGIRQILAAALSGCGIGYVPFALAGPHLDAGRLVPVLEDWWPAYPGYHLYYPGSRQPSRAMSVLIEALRYRP
ncbi:DNA-binding transcriptional LysR family regulator [Xanthomonas campestris]|uniref:LysR family transcriptional regulator n=1 Tax=Xanthomonas sp. CFBP 8151 TaxID=3035310 RepID=UPI00141B72FD|nr:LysR family transcriptional regulator [Xanthomonas sp. CFBP 8151]MEB1611108.1 LysR family transcriptional regulator [Xanthomonas campestris pv. campestris]NIJ75538.1 DNA-binding transcriptional LysR family regulator [Xanthomonas sp. CFBP 8151]